MSPAVIRSNQLWVIALAVILATAQPTKQSVALPQTSVAGASLIKQALTLKPRPSFDDDVLPRLRQAQAEEQARVEAQEAAERAEVARQEQLAAEAAAAAQTAREQAVAPVVAPSGSCSEWLAAAGVADVAHAMVIIQRESGCNPYAVNPSSGSCGVAQELPCGKSGCPLGDGACQVRWMNSYVIARYTSWAGAVEHSDATGWY